MKKLILVLTLTCCSSSCFFGAAEEGDSPASESEKVSNGQDIVDAMRQEIVDAVNRIFIGKSDTTRVRKEGAIFQAHFGHETEAYWQVAQPGNAACAMLKRQFTDIVPHLRSAMFTHIQSLQNREILCRL